MVFTCLERALVVLSCWSCPRPHYTTWCPAHATGLFKLMILSGKGHHLWEMPNKRWTSFLNSLNIMKCLVGLCRVLPVPLGNGLQEFGGGWRNGPINEPNYFSLVLFNIQFYLLYSLFLLGLRSWLQYFEGGLFYIFTYIYHTVFQKGIKATMSSYTWSK